MNNNLFLLENCTQYLKSANVVIAHRPIAGWVSGAHALRAHHSISAIGYSDVSRGGGVMRS